MADTLAIFYTGDVRHNQHLRRQNHQKLFDKLGTMVQYKVYEFTRDDPDRGICPYDPPGGLDPDTSYHRGQGGAVQVWDFLRGVQRTQEPLVMKLRTDLYFTNTSIDIISKELLELLACKSDIIYFGCDWSKEYAGTVNNRRQITFDTSSIVSDFVVLARREHLKTYDETIADINRIQPERRKNGNRTFKYIIPFDGPQNKKAQYTKVFRVLCQIWLIRQNYDHDPGDMIVCRDYIQSYITTYHTYIIDKKRIPFPHPNQTAVDWWRQTQGMEPKLIEIDRCTEWQLP